MEKLGYELNPVIGDGKFKKNRGLSYMNTLKRSFRVSNKLLSRDNKKEKFPVLGSRPTLKIERK